MADDDIRLQARRELARRELARRRAAQTMQPGVTQPAPQQSSPQSGAWNPTPLPREIIDPGYAFSRNMASTGMLAGQKVDDFVRATGNGLTLGVADRIAGVAGGEGTDAERARSEVARARSPVITALGEIGGSALGIGKLMGAGATATRFVNPASTGAKKFLGTTAASVADGLAYNTLANLGYGKDATENAGLAAIIGGVAPAIASVAGGVTNAVSGMLGKGNDSRAKQMILKALKNSGKTPQDIASDINQAIADGQPMYTLADSLGNSGQRMLSGVVRQPGDMRQTATEILMNRQAGQSDRLTNALVEGFDAPMTAAQKAAELKNLRSSTASQNYAKASETGGPVNLTDAIAEIDRVLKVDPILGETALSQGVLGQRMQALRDRIQKGGEQLVDFDSVVRVKSDIRRMLKAKPEMQGDFKPVMKALDSALEKASPDYRAANDTFARQSRTMEAVDAGSQAASGRLRSQDTIPQFQSLPVEDQAAFRVGYVDPMIARIQGGPSGPMTDRMRQIMTPKTAEEFQAFASPGMADQLSRRLGRERTMFDTSVAALGGSKTADNLADIADVDASVIGNLLSGNLRQMAISGIGQAANMATGRNQATRDMIAKALLSTGRNAPKQIFDAIETGKKLTLSQRKIAGAIIGSMLPALQQIQNGQR